MARVRSQSSLYSHGGRREGAGRPVVEPRFLIKARVDAKIRDKWNELKAKGSFDTNASFLYLSSAETRRRQNF